jgi:hypothetical protein
MEKIADGAMLGNPSTSFCFDDEKEKREQPVAVPVRVRFGKQAY